MYGFIWHCAVCCINCFYLCLVECLHFWETRTGLAPNVLRCRLFKSMFVFFLFAQKPSFKLHASAVCQGQYWHHYETSMFKPVKFSVHSVKKRLLSDGCSHVVDLRWLFRQFSAHKDTFPHCIIRRRLPGDTHCDSSVVPWLAARRKSPANGIVSGLYIAIRLVLSWVGQLTVTLWRYDEECYRWNYLWHYWTSGLDYYAYCSCICV